MNNKGIEKITIIHLKESTPFKYIKRVGWITNKIANNTRKDFELFMFEFFIDADANT